MIQKTIIILLITFGLTLSSLPLMAQTKATQETKATQAISENVPALLVTANEAYKAKDFLTFRRALEGLHKLRPNNSDYMYQLVIAHALLDEKRQAYDLMLRMQKQGLSYNFLESDNTMNIRGTQVFDYVNDLMKLAADPFGEAEPVFVLPDSLAMPEAISWDESRQKLLIGTVSEGQIIAVGKDGQITELLKANAENGLWGILDILVDQPGNRLWVTSASVPEYSRFDQVDRGRSALFEFNLETLELIHRYPVPVDGQPHALGSIVLSPDGTVFIADRTLPLIYSKAVGEQKIQPVMGLKRMVSLRGIAMSSDGSTMYVADREMGIMVIDVNRAQARFLQAPETLNLGGIDGLYFKDNHLFIIQNGIKPQRVMRLQLDASGTKVEQIRPLAVAQPEFDFPSYGTIEGENLYYFANSHWSKASGSQIPVTVLRTPLDSSGELTEPEMRLFLDQQAEQHKKRLQEEKNN